MLAFALFDRCVGPVLPPTSMRIPLGPRAAALRPEQPLPACSPVSGPVQQPCAAPASMCTPSGPVQQPCIAPASMLPRLRPPVVTAEPCAPTGSDGGATAGYWR